MLARGLMPTTTDKTSTDIPLPLVLAVHCSSMLLRRCTEASARIDAGVYECDILSMSTVAARRRPLAIVVPAHIHAFDPLESDALAQAVGAMLIIVDEDITQRDLDDLISAAGAELRRGEYDGTSVGRYSLVNREPKPESRRGPPASGT